MRRLCDFTVDDFVECVDAVAFGVESVHEMHDCDLRIAFLLLSVVVH